MSSFKLSHQAILYLTDIWNYTFDNWSEKQADFYYEMLIRNCQKIADNPKLGKDYSTLISGTLGYKAGRISSFIANLFCLM